MKSFKILSMACLIFIVFLGMEAIGSTPKNLKQEIFAMSNPQDVLLIKNKTTSEKNKVIGSVKIATYNSVGIKRQEAVINELLQSNAAKLGGNAVIDIHQANNHVYGKVVKL